MGSPSAGRGAVTNTSIIGLLFALLLGAASGPLASAGADTEGSDSTATPAADLVPPPAPPTTAGGTASGDFEELLAQLTVADEGTSPYDRGRFRHWTRVEGTQCDTRVAVLVAESRVPVTQDGCRVTAGDWLSPYDGLTWTNPSSLDIDHMVPLKEAWESGASEWTDEERKAYANDLSEPFALLGVTNSQNRSKADKDPADYRPPLTDYWCTYAQAWVRVKSKWDLTVDEAEVTALEEMLATC